MKEVSAVELEQLESYRAVQREHQQVEQLRAELLARYDKLSADQAGQLLAVETAIESLEPTLRTLMRYHYIMGLEWEKIADRMHYSRRRIYELRTEALERLKTIETMEPGN